MASAAERRLHPSTIRDLYSDQKRARKAIRQALNLERRGKWLEAEDVLFRESLTNGSTELDEATAALRTRYHEAGRPCDKEQLEYARGADDDDDARA